MHLQFYLLFLSLFFVLPLNGQQKQIEGDTAYWFSREVRLVEKLELRDLSLSSIPFEFRFSNGHQFVDVWQSGDTLAGVLTNYTMKLGRNYDNIDTLFTKTILPREDLEKIITLLEENKISKLPSDNAIKDWGQGFDGITYRFQFSSPEKLIYNTYWAPYIYDTLPEARKVLFAVDSITNLFNLEQEYESFFKSLPRNGSYQYSGTSILINPVNNFSVGYLGSIKMPFGVKLSHYFANIGDLETYLSLDVECRINTKRDYNFDFSLRKWNVFFNDNDKINGSFHLFGRKRRIQTVDFGKRVHSVNSAYQVSFIEPGLALGTGLSQVFGDEKQAGIYILASYRWNKINLYLGSRLSLFSDRQDTYFYIQKNFYTYLGGNNLHFSARVFSESFRGFFDTGLSVSVSL